MISNDRGPAVAGGKTRRSPWQSGPRRSRVSGIPPVLGWLVCVGLSLWAWHPARAQPEDATAGDSRPNVIVLFLDDQAFSAIGGSGNPDVRTPQMDRLAAEGVFFERHYNSTAICMASRASLMTGCYEYKTGCNFMHGPLKPERFALSYPVLLRQAGYRTGFGGKFGFAVADDESTADNQWERLPVDAFDAWAGGLGQTQYKTAENRYLKRFAEKYPHSTRAYGAFGQEFIRQSAGQSQPFCLTLFFKAPHYPQTPDPFFDDIYRGVTFALPGNHGPENGAHLAPQSRLGRQYLDLYRRFGFDRDGYQEAIRKYYQLIYGVDYALGMLREELAAQGLEKNTVIVLTSDNGYFCGSHGFGGKVLLYEEGVRAPLIVMDPRHPETAGQRCDALTATVDVAPTVLQLAGLDPPAIMDGVSLLPWIQGRRPDWRQVLPLFQMWGNPEILSMAVVTRHHKYLYWCYGETMEPSHELFDLQQDRLELVNRFDHPDYAAAQQQLQADFRVALKHLQQNAVAEGHYREFGVLLDPAVSWEQKRKILPPPWRQRPGKEKLPSPVPE